MKLVEESKPLAAISVDDYDGVLLVGGQGPMYTFWNDERVHALVASFYEAGKVTAVICHATCVLLKTRLADGHLLVEGKTWTGFANSEERYADDFVGRKIQPFWIEDEAKKLENTNFIVSARFKPHAVRDGNLITGQQQYSGAAAARLDDRGAGHLRCSPKPDRPDDPGHRPRRRAGVLRRPDRARGPDRERRLPDLQLRRRQPPRRHPQLQPARASRRPRPPGG